MVPMFPAEPNVRPRLQAPGKRPDLRAMFNLPIKPYQIL